MDRTFWEFAVRPVFELTQPKDGQRIELGADFDHLVLRYGQPGVLRGWDHKGVGLQEVRQLDFGDLPAMDERDYARLMRLVHTPEWVMVHASGQKVSKPVTGHWVRRDERDFDRLSRMPVLGEVTR